MIDQGMLCSVDITSVVWVVVAMVCFGLSDFSLKWFRGCSFVMNYKISTQPI